MSMPKLQNKSFWFYDNLYKHNYLLIIGDSSWCKSYIEKKYGFDLNFVDTCKARTSFIEGYGIVVWFPKFRSNAEYYSYLSHEIFHCALMVMDHIHFTVTLDYDEPVAYYIEFLTRKFLEIIKGK